MADIAFLLLVFFLVTTTMDTDFGLNRKLPPPEPDDVESPPVKERNVFEVLANAQNKLLVEGNVMEIKDLKEEAKRFIANPENDPDLPEKKVVDVPFFGETKVSKQVISLQNDRGTSYELYIQVQNELARAYKELRNELAREQFGKSFEQLRDLGEKEKVKAVRKIYPMRISEAEPKNSEQ